MLLAVFECVLFLFYVVLLLEWLVSLFILFCLLFDFVIIS